MTSPKPSPAELVKKWRDRANTFRALLGPKDMPAERVDVCADELEAVLPAWEARIRSEAQQEMREKCAQEILSFGLPPILRATAMKVIREVPLAAANEGEGT